VSKSTTTGEVFALTEGITETDFFHDPTGFYNNREYMQMWLMNFLLGGNSKLSAVLL
jgi:hypothetical protein